MCTAALILQDNFRKLENWARSRWTQAGEVVYKWSGQVQIIPVKHLNYLLHDRCVL